MKIIVYFLETNKVSWFENKKIGDISSKLNETSSENMFINVDQMYHRVLPKIMSNIGITKMNESKFRVRILRNPEKKTTSKPQK